MGRSYSDDLRVRVAGFVEAGHSRRGAARHFGVSESFAVKLLQRASRLKTLRPARHGRPPGSRLDAHGAFRWRRSRPGPTSLCRNSRPGSWKRQG